MSIKHNLNTDFSQMFHNALMRVDFQRVNVEN